MKTSSPAVTLKLITERKRKDGLSPIFISIAWKGTRVKESTGVFMSEKDFKKGLYKTNRQLRKRLDEIDSKIVELMEEKKPFTAKECLGGVKDKIRYEAVLLDMARVKKLSAGSVKTYKTALYSLKQYFGEDFLLTDLTQANIQGYARATGVQPSTMCCYLKCLTALLTYAEGKGLIKENPMRGWKFKSDGFKNTDKPKSITRAEVTVIIKVFETTKDRKLKVASGVWLAAFYFNGLALVDLVRVDWDNLEEELIGKSRFYRFNIRRQKTNEIAAVMTPVFPTTQKILSLMREKPWKEHSTIHGFQIFINKYLQRIMPNLTYYQARHTFASLMVGSRTPINVIASMMGRSINGIATYITRVTESNILANAAEALKRAEILETPPEDLFFD